MLGRQAQGNLVHKPSLKYNKIQQNTIKPKNKNTIKSKNNL
jgi:hypothetical protein